MTTYTRWSVSPAELTGLTPVKARDLIVQCFHAAQKEHLADASEFIHQPHKESDLRDMVIGAVRLAFKEAVARVGLTTPKSGAPSIAARPSACRSASRLADFAARSAAS